MQEQLKKISGFPSSSCNTMSFQERQHLRRSRYTRQTASHWRWKLKNCFTPNVDTIETKNESVQYPSTKRKTPQLFSYQKSQKGRNQLIPEITLPDGLHVSLSITRLKAVSTKTTRPILMKLGYPTKQFFSSRISSVRMN